MLKGIPISKARSIIEKASLNERIADFIKAHTDRCMIMTGNLDVWIEGLLDRLNMRGRCMCSEALLENEHLMGVNSVLDKAKAVRVLKHPFVAIGDGDNDIGMLQAADLGIVFGGSRRISNDMKKLQIL